MACLLFIDLMLVFALVDCNKPGPVDDKAAGAAAALPEVNAPAPTTASFSYAKCI